MPVINYLLLKSDKSDSLDKLITLFGTKEVYSAINSKSVIIESDLIKLSIPSSPTIKATDKIRYDWI